MDRASMGTASEAGQAGTGLPSPRLRTALAGLAGLVLLAGACGGGGGGGGDDGGGDGRIGAGAPPETGDAAPGEGSAAAGIAPCDLLDVAAIEAQFGDVGPVSDGQTHGSDPATSCTWVIDDGSEYTPPTLNLSVLAESSQSAEEFLATTRQDKPDAVDVAGLGDEAFFDVNGLYFRSGEVAAAVSLFPVPDAGTLQPKLLALAQQVATRL